MEQVLAIPRYIDLGGVIEDALLVDTKTVLLAVRVQGGARLYKLSLTTWQLRVVAEATGEWDSIAATPAGLAVSKGGELLVTDSRGVVWEGEFTTAWRGASTLYVETNGELITVNAAGRVSRVGRGDRISYATGLSGAVTLIGNELIVDVAAGRRVIHTSSGEVVLNECGAVEYRESMTIIHCARGSYRIPGTHELRFVACSATGSLVGYESRSSLVVAGSTLDVLRGITGCLRGFDGLLLVDPTGAVNLYKPSGYSVRLASTRLVDSKLVVERPTSRLVVAVNGATLAYPLLLDSSRLVNLASRSRLVISASRGVLESKASGGVEVRLTCPCTTVVAGEPVHPCCYPRAKLEVRVSESVRVESHLPVPPIRLLDAKAVMRRVHVEGTSGVSVSPPPVLLSLRLWSPYQLAARATLRLIYADGVSEKSVVVEPGESTVNMELASAPMRASLLLNNVESSSIDVDIDEEVLRVRVEAAGSLPMPTGWLVWARVSGDATGYWLAVCNSECKVEEQVGDTIVVADLSGLVGLSAARLEVLDYNVDTSSVVVEATKKGYTTIACTNEPVRIELVEEGVHAIPLPAGCTLLHWGSPLEAPPLSCEPELLLGSRGSKLSIASNSDANLIVVHRRGLLFGEEVEVDPFTGRLKIKVACVGARREVELDSIRAALVAAAASATRLAGVLESLKLL